VWNAEVLPTVTIFAQREGSVEDLQRVAFAINKKRLPSTTKAVCWMVLSVGLQPIPDGGSVLDEDSFCYCETPDTRIQVECE